jgi:uracil-DNA glycosylase
MSQPIVPERNRRPQLPDSWLEVIGDEFEKPHMHQLRTFLLEEKCHYPVFPPGDEIFSAFWLTPFDQVRVVILGQDPYHGPGQAHGLAFSVRRGVPAPPSLDNIFKELATDLGLARPEHGDLSAWARQGVLLLNATLTVRAHSANSHRNQGWEQLTDRVVRELAIRRSGLVFVLWGSSAGQKARMVDHSSHLIISAPHPSPLSAYRGFFGSRPFSKINTYLSERGETPIQWDLSAARE